MSQSKCLCLVNCLLQRVGHPIRKIIELTTHHDGVSHGNRLYQGTNDRIAIRGGNGAGSTRSVFQLKEPFKLCHVTTWKLLSGAAGQAIIGQRLRSPDGQQLSHSEWPSLGMPAKKSMGDTGNATQEIVVGKTSGPFHVQTLTNRLSTLKLAKDEGKPAVLVGRVQELEQKPGENEPGSGKARSSSCSRSWSSR